MAQQPDHMALLMPARLVDWSIGVAVGNGIRSRFDGAQTLAQLETLVADGARFILSFGTGVIVPAHVLDVPGMQAINVHAASPEFPGRDPHHFAAYAGVRRYGATLHRMIRKVDAGAILMTELEPVPDHARPQDLLDLGNRCGRRLVERLFGSLASGHGIPSPDPALEWSVTVGTRKRFLELCRIDPSMSADEMRRRIHACSMPGRQNVHLDLHGQRFFHLPEAAS